MGGGIAAGGWCQGFRYPMKGIPGIITSDKLVRRLLAINHTLHGQIVASNFDYENPGEDPDTSCPI